MSSLKINRKKFKRALRGLMISVVALSMLLAESATLAFAQAETGSITGTISDPSGAVVAAANVVIKSVETGLERRTLTTDAGTYTITNLQPGIYDVRIEAQGFAPRTQRAQVTVGAKLSLDFDLSAQASSFSSRERLTRRANSPAKRSRFRLALRTSAAAIAITSGRLTLTTHGKFIRE